MSDQTDALLATLAEFALSLPEAWEDTPWDSTPVTKVRKKIFVFHSGGDDPGISVKLIESLDHGLSLPGASPVGYGLGRHGWTYIPLGDAGPDEAELMLDFIEESYRAVAPKTLVKQLDAAIAADDG